MIHQKKDSYQTCPDLEDSSDESLSDSSEDDTQNVDPPSDRPTDKHSKKTVEKKLPKYISRTKSLPIHNKYLDFISREFEKRPIAPKKQETKVEYDLITQQGDIKDPLKGGKVRTARLKWRKERSDFRDRPAEK